MTAGQFAQFPAVNETHALCLSNTIHFSPINRSSGLDNKLFKPLILSYDIALISFYNLYHHCHIHLTCLNVLLRVDCITCDDCLHDFSLEASLFNGSAFVMLHIFTVSLRIFVINTNIFCCFFKWSPNKVLNRHVSTFCFTFLNQNMSFFKIGRASCRERV